jgi:hypothetical protein
MSKELIRIAKKVAKQEDLIYAPDEDALAWMKTFAKIIKVRERELCAQVCEGMDLPLAAAAIRERKDDDG